MAHSADESQMLQGSRQRGNTLLEQWAREFREPLKRYFQKRTPRSVDPNDLVQEVFVRLARRADLATIERVEGYLFRTAASVLADQFRKDGRAPEIAAPYEETVHGVEDLSPERVLAGRESLDELIKALYALPERTRHIFVLYHFENVRQKDIAANLGMPISTIEKHMARANKHLLKCMERTS